MYVQRPFLVSPKIVFDISTKTHLGVSSKIVSDVSPNIGLMNIKRVVRCVCVWGGGGGGIYEEILVYL